MNPSLEAALRSWPFDPWLSLTLMLLATVYLRGWMAYRARGVNRWGTGSLVLFLGGLGAIYLALASPIEPFAALLLQVHMVQHLLLTMVAPPLLWLSAPMLPLIRGLPLGLRLHWIGPLYRWPALRRLLGTLTHPVPTLVLLVAASWAWHVPALYELALLHPTWHYVQHGCFLGTALLFWYPVVRPFPSRPRWPTWILVPCLILADVQNTLLSALLTFADQPLYSYYAMLPSLGAATALDDQSAAGVIMWVPGSVAYLVPLFCIGMGMFTRQRDTQPVSPHLQAGRLGLPLVGQHPETMRRGLDLVRLGIVGKFLRWRHARLAMQIPLLLLAVIVIYDGLCGPATGPMNLAGVLPWIHWRGILILGLLAVGNLFCMGCPFLLPRTLARKWLPASLPWPRWLRHKWPAVVLLVAFLWAYEAFALWDSPWWTAWLAIGYFAIALVIDGIFRGASFCKYICPIGQFNFVQSLASPFEVRTQDPAVCLACRSKDCIRGRAAIPGCELHLYQPRKVGNMDCTLCLDCVHACPHDNIGIVPVVPTADLWDDPQRSGVGKFSQRLDIAALVLVLCFGAFANAAGMIAPVLAWRDDIARVTSLSPLAITSLLYFCSLLLLPAILVTLAAILSRRLGRLAMDWRKTAVRFSYAFLPLGFAMWVTHYSFHLLTSYETVLPTGQRFLADLGIRLMSHPDYFCTCCLAAADWLLKLELVALDLGLLLSLYAAYRIAARMTGGSHVRALLTALPWAILMVGLFIVAVWIVFQPMEMRGTLAG